MQGIGLHLFDGQSQVLFPFLWPLLFNIFVSDLEVGVIAKDDCILCKVDDTKVERTVFSVV